ncbi:ribulose-phosphate 3-epimerase [Enterococcus pallens]|uniref:Ribulose-phosphate 3-epimerase n=1 Tax=Enterococcus pallens ATCC BAA-351 TaxID=1158607 RepID=R2QF40_9ENTE|nr:ribulose-phosphate 3-epimerase [Enterococcus pallens]EOH93848.1 ribulose-phosphate 3-epimerase [Enterococcus pallens ATCC BAA-351]EOU24688.1 ribulose-phosphate 3-epimerase [Enterococcus pallens ATCC BAA-351]
MVKNSIMPSLFGADIGNLQRDVMTLKDLEIEILHVDMMDGSFVPNIAFGPTQVADLKKLLPFQFDVHMMVENPEKFIPQLVEAGVEYISIHQEATVHLLRGIQLIKQLGAKAGVVLNPGTPVESIKLVLDEIDYVLLMTVNPGLGGQQLYPPIYQKIQAMKKLIGERPINIQVDGGVNAENIKTCQQAGANWFVVGSYLFSGDSTKKFQLLENALR